MWGTIVLDLLYFMYYSVYRTNVPVAGELVQKRKFAIFWTRRRYRNDHQGGIKMEKQMSLTFGEIMKQNKRRVNYHIHRLSLQDQHQKFYQRSLVILWNPYEKYHPDIGVLSTYFNFTIRHHLDVMRRKSQEQE